MIVYVVYYDSVSRGRDGPEESRTIYGVYGSAEKAKAACKELEKKYKFYTSFEGFEVE